MKEKEKKIAACVAPVTAFTLLFRLLQPFFQAGSMCNVHIFQSRRSLEWQMLPYI